MNKAEMVDALEARLGGRKQAVSAVEAVVELIQLTVAKGDKVAISGFGTFEKQARNARTGRNPRTGEAVKIKKTSVPRFRPGTAFKEIVSDTKALRAFQAEVKERTAGPAAAPAKKAAATPAARKAAPARTAPVKAAPARTSTATAKKAAPPARTTSTTTARKAAPAKTATTTRRVAKKA
ncbi:HU family DNA-binding protein [Kineococcus radiotolerans]|uniref:Histone family protein DNA-binding protein n=1 Tax=Kineococcus radiotolerans (strain ATCC BAA-149 / DSM 14245 / SRS30216) TaxID=266940 RepID=A6W7Q9_KINRD|nr:HU family DNA-binding protein [Kineococcus radiotolerans]ABS02848.1 histone family protein DNA-binding protein [Kineococcus radiotolerans SRS30216 = ATCC BAA-149]